MIKLKVLKVALECNLGEKPKSIITGGGKYREIRYLPPNRVEFYNIDDPPDSKPVVFKNIRLRSLTIDNEVAILLLVFDDPTISKEAMRFLGKEVFIDDNGFHTEPKAVRA